MRLEELPSKPPKILEYGPFGSGKTAFAETLGEYLQYFDIDDGSVTGLRLVDSHQTNRRSIDVEVFRENPTNPTAFSKIKDRIMNVSTLCNQGTYKFKAICVDSLTTMGEAALRYVLSNSSHLGKPPQLQHWGLAMDEVKNVLLTLRSLPIVVILIAHDLTEEVDGSNQKNISVIGQKLTDKVPTYFDEVWYFKTKLEAGGITKYRIQTKPTTAIPARTRFGAPSDYDASLGMKKMMLEIGFDFDKFESPFQKTERLKAVTTGAVKPAEPPKEGGSTPTSTTDISKKS